MIYEMSARFRPEANYRNSYSDKRLMKDGEMSGVDPVDSLNELSNRSAMYHFMVEDLPSCNILYCLCFTVKTRTLHHHRAGRFVSFRSRSQYISSSWENPANMIIFTACFLFYRKLTQH